MSKIKAIFKGLTILSQSWAYAKMSQKTGMSIAELDLFKENYRAVSKQAGYKISVFFKEHTKKNRAIKLKKINADKTTKNIKKEQNKTELKKLLFQDKPLQCDKPNL